MSTNIDALVEKFKAAGTSVGDVQIECILANLTNQEVLDIIQRIFGKRVKTTAKCVSWYRSHLKNDKARKFAQYRERFSYDEGSKRWVEKDTDQLQLPL